MESPNPNWTLYGGVRLSVLFRPPTPWFWNGLDWKALVQLRPPNIEKLRRKHFFFFFFQQFFFLNFYLKWFFQIFPHFFHIFNSGLGWTGELWSNRVVLVLRIKEFLQKFRIKKDFYWFFWDFWICWPFFNFLEILGFSMDFLIFLKDFLDLFLNFFLNFFVFFCFFDFFFFLGGGCGVILSILWLLITTLICQPSDQLHRILNIYY